jgi:hypothetical protein
MSGIPEGHRKAGLIRSFASKGQHFHEKDGVEKNTAVRVGLDENFLPLDKSGMRNASI